MKKLLTMLSLLLTVSLAAQDIEVRWPVDFTYNTAIGAMYVGDPITTPVFLVMYQEKCAMECAAKGSDCAMRHYIWTDQYRRLLTMTEAEELMTTLANDRNYRRIFMQILLQPID